MFSLDMKDRAIYIIDPMPMLDWAPKDDASKYNLDIIKKLG
jgi:hypothetical protein